jgi:hypothetical protein
MAYEFRSNLDLDASLYDATGAHNGMPRLEIVDGGRRRGLGDYFLEGLAVPDELMSELPHTLLIRGRANAGYAGGYGAFLFDEVAYDLVRQTGAPHWHWPVPTVVDAHRVPIAVRWYMVAFPLLVRSRHFVDLAHSDYVEFPAAYTSGGVSLRIKDPFGKLAFFRSSIAGLTLWRGAGGDTLTGQYYCADAFRQAWETAGLVGLKFEPVLET